MTKLYHSYGKSEAVDRAAPTVSGPLLTTKVILYNVNIVTVTIILELSSRPYILSLEIYRENTF